MRRALVRRAIVGLSVVAVVTAVAAPAMAIVGGTPDGGRHPNVGVLEVEFDDGSAQLCSGTLIAPAVVLTAAHCVDAPGVEVVYVHVSFDERPEVVDFFIQPPFIAGTPVAHPDWVPSEFATTPDVAVVVLDEPAATYWPGIEPADLAPVGYLDRLVKGGTHGQRHLFTAVGYGTYRLDRPGPPAFAVLPLARRQADVRFDELWEEIVWVKQFGQTSAVAGGTSYGDSGGPLFDDGLLVGVNSHCDGSHFGGWERSSSPFWFCEGPGFAASWRTDAPRVHDFVAGYATSP